MVVVRSEMEEKKRRQKYFHIEISNTCGSTTWAIAYYFSLYQSISRVGFFSFSKMVKHIIHRKVYKTYYKVLESDFLTDNRP